MPQVKTEARNLVDVARQMYQRGFIAASDGNVSLRIGTKTVLVTPSGVNKGSLRPSDLVRVHLDGSVLSRNGVPSSELAMHLAIYRSRPDAAAVVHAHPPYATGFASARIPLRTEFFPEAVLSFGSIPLAPYATPSTSEVPASLMPFLDSAHAILLASHGVVTFGRSLAQAWERMQKVEQLAHASFVAMTLGGGVPLTEGEILSLRHAAEKIRRPAASAPRKRRGGS